ncbi:TIGR02186 family protein [Xanthobacter oligotrophicus]|uniref:TIGR02186 family protein n=1 Tax=Xanthobacter oligotrophicus TaxID=2607286 RepID=UPI0011F2A425|nr:TIGR02186 family protein [Xanthobacter oligotrophicus]MCG5234526.1 TIGR02186 family protein [Xanthobacter oligotrophicus]
MRERVGAAVRTLRIGSALLALMIALAAMPARADRLVVSVSQPQVRITSSFTGAELVVFGVAETQEQDDGPIDVVVTVRGPGERFTTWRKSRVLGLWVNSDRRTFVEAPAFLAVLSNRPTDQMASPETLRVEQIGLNYNILVQKVGPDFADVVPSDPFRTAFLRIQATQGVYREDPGGVAFLAPRVFRAEVSIPGTAPLGRYTVAVKVFRNGSLSATELSSFDVNKTGFEQKIAEFSQRDGWLYGLVVAFGSLVVGFMGNLLFRRD